VTLPEMPAESVDPQEPEPSGPVPVSRQMVAGAVTFLDVLGWKGIWLRRDPNEVVRLLEELVKRAEAITSEQRGGALASEVRVLSISDTIVLLTPGDADKVLPVHGLICRELVPESIQMGIPLRGATSHGQFSVSEGTILVGPGVDEAASWHEALDWIGVVMTPSAEYKCEPCAPWCKYAKAPVKGLGSRELWCVDWSERWADDTEIRKLFSEVGPMDTAIAVKYMNTLDFLRNRISNRSKPAQQ
jgi:hypothetical protein